MTRRFAISRLFFLPWWPFDHDSRGCDRNYIKMFTVCQIVNDATARACNSFLPGEKLPMWNDAVDGTRLRTAHLITRVLARPGITVDELLRFDGGNRLDQSDPHYDRLIVVWEAFIGMVESMRDFIDPKTLAGLR